MTEPQPVPCNFCGDLILWLTTDRQVRMPVDAQPVDTGNVIRQGSQCGVLNHAKRAAAANAGRPLYQHHKLSCRKASEWSRGH